MVFLCFLILSIFCIRVVFCKAIIFILEKQAIKKINKKMASSDDIEDYDGVVKKYSRLC